MLARMSVTRAHRLPACSLVLAMLAVGCLSARPPVEPVRLPVASPPAVPRPSGASIGLVLTGGGAFGAWEVGALRAFFDAWLETYGEEPPIRVVAGASTGALIAPFALLGRTPQHDYLDELATWYTTVRQSDVAAPRAGALLPFPLFAATTSSVYGVGYTGADTRHARRLYGRLVAALSPPRLGLLAADWPERRLAVVSLDFTNGRPSTFTNAPRDIDRLRAGVLASAMAPLAFPPVPLVAPDGAASGGRPTPHLDGGVYAVAPIGELLAVAAQDPPITLTHIVVLAAFPAFPGGEGDPVQPGAFPSSPSFKEVGDRMNALLSEASATKEIALLRPAIALREAGVGEAAVATTTGLRLGGPPPRLIELAPGERLGWHALSFDPVAMREMLRRGYREGRQALTGLAAERR